LFGCPCRHARHNDPHAGYEDISKEAPESRRSPPLRAKQSASVVSVTKQLFVLRHAKSSWDDPGLDDHERPLAPRGHRAVKMLAAHIRDHAIRPEQVLCSSARRTRETYEGIEPGGELVVEPTLFGASAGDVLDRLHRVPEDTASVMVIGHNPALQVLLLRLVGGNGNHDGRLVEYDGDGTSILADLQRKFPTGALATLRFDCAWNELSAGRATLVDVVRPRDLH
jgi:phosphohistidine phosphatase